MPDIKTDDGCVIHVEVEGPQDAPDAGQRYRDRISAIRRRNFTSMEDAAISGAKAPNAAPSKWDSMRFFNTRAQFRNQRTGSR